MSWPGHRRVAQARSATAIRARAAALAVVVALVAVAVSTPRPTLAQTPEDVGVRLVVSFLTGVLGPGSVRPLDPQDAADPRPVPSALDLRLLVEHEGELPLDQLRAVVEIHPEVDSRAELHRVLAGELTTVPLHVHERQVLDGDHLGPGDISGIEVRVEPDEIDWAPDGGVHPLRIAVMRGTQVLSQVVTAVVWLPEVPVAPVRTVLVWPIDDRPAKRIGDVHAAEGDRPLRAGGRLDALLRALERVSDAPVTLAASAHLLEELRDRADGFVVVEQIDQTEHHLRTVAPEDAEARRANDTLQRIRRLADVLPHAPIASTYVDADLPSLLSDTSTPELRELASLAAVEGPRRLQQVLGNDTDATTHLVSGPVSPAALDLLPAGQVIVPHSSLRDLDRTDALVPLQSGAGRTITALVADDHLSRLLSTVSISDDALLVAQHVVASTAMHHLERPDASDRILVVAPDPRWDPGTAIASAVLEQLMAASWLDPVSPATVGSVGRRSVVPAQAAAPGPSMLSPELTDELTRARLDLAAAVQALPEGVTTIDGHQPDDLADALLRATSRWLLEPDRGGADLLVREVRFALDQTFGSVDIDQTRITLTSDTGSIPVTLERTSGGPMTVMVEVASPGRLAWPDGRRSEPIVLEPGARQTVSFATEARSTGTFPVTVRVTDPSGHYELEGATLSVRSTALSRPALVATGALIAVLLVVGLLRRNAPARRLRVVSSEDDRPPTVERRY